MNFATIRQSLSSITDNLYSKEKFTEKNQGISIDNLKEKEFQEQLKKQYQNNIQKLYDTKNKTIEKDYKAYTNDKKLDGSDNKDYHKDYHKDDDKDDDKKVEIKMIDSIDMDNFNEQILKEKNKNAEKNREMVTQQINNINLEKQQREEKLKQREQKQKDLIDKGAFDSVKNDWYWSSYNNNLKKTSYSEIDNSLDNLKASNYLSVPLSHEYKIIGNDETNQEEEKVQMAKPFIYKSPLKDYIYDVKNNKLVTYNISEKNEEDHKIIPTISPTISPILLPTISPTLTAKEGFTNDINVDPKLFEIYQKTLTTKKNTVSYDVDYTYNYVFVLIIIIVLFLLFKSS